MQLRKHSIVGWLALALAGAITVAVAFADRPLLVPIPQAGIQAAIESTLPLVDRGKHHVYQITAATIQLRDGDVVDVEARFTAELYGRFTAGTMLARTKTKYRDGRLWLDSVDVYQVTLDRLELVHPPSTNERSILERAVQTLLRDFLKGRTIYELEPTTLRRRLALSLVREIHVEAGRALVSLNPLARGLIGENQPAL